ncbi:virulence RhuM family protein [Candidatus Azambacteria bacterium]|nr:virulence RhuM family protein [Candidatus Azambacteria bacterium]
MQFYNLDVILAVGYRTNSKRAIEFRKWATKTLRSYIVDDSAINKNRITKNYAQLLVILRKYLYSSPPAKDDGGSVSYGIKIIKLNELF